jgi:hypothetical protein
MRVASHRVCREAIPVGSLEVPGQWNVLQWTVLWNRVNKRNFLNMVRKHLVNYRCVQTFDGSPLEDPTGHSIVVEVYGPAPALVAVQKAGGEHGFLAKNEFAMSRVVGRNAIGSGPETGRKAPPQYVKEIRRALERECQRVYPKAGDPK